MNSQEQALNQEKKIFESNIRREILNFVTGEKCEMQGGKDMEFTDSDIKKITEICSQNSVYELLFRRMLDGKPYTEKEAQGFVDWVKEGWNKQTHFVFFVRKSDSEIVGAIDIKSADLTRGEVGYWADENYRGFMTNTVNELISTAKGVGYKKLFAEVKIENSKSIGVLERAGFNKMKEIIKENGSIYFGYEKQL